MKQSKLSAITVTVAAVLLSFFSACGSSGSGGASVVEINVNDSPLTVGEASVVEVDFSFDAGDVFNGNEPVSIVIHLPAGVAYRAGSGHIDVPFGLDKDVGGLVTSCTSDDSFVQFNLDEGDLNVATNPTGNADATLTFTIDALAPTVGTVDGRADEVGSFVCGQPFEPEASAAVEVS